MSIPHCLRPLLHKIPSLLAGMMLAGVMAGTAGVAMATETGLQAVIDGEHRSAEERARDVYRHPRETLEFFDVQPDMTVLEVWPGANGWYTGILAPYLRAQGTLYAAHFRPDSQVDYFRNARQAFDKKMADRPDLFDRVTVIAFEPPHLVELAPAGSVDRVLTFRNVHNWFMSGGEEAVLTAFRAFYKTLKPGGVLGVVDHRLPADSPADRQARSGYLHEEMVVRLAREAGFELEANSSVNANPKDTADHPSGVWSLLPALRVEESLREKYRNIGESDRMTLKFVKL